MVKVSVKKVMSGLGRRILFVVKYLLSVGWMLWCTCSLWNSISLSLSLFLFLSTHTHTHTHLTDLLMTELSFNQNKATSRNLQQSSEVSRALIISHTPISMHLNMWKMLHYNIRYICIYMYLNLLLYSLTKWCIVLRVNTIPSCTCICNSQLAYHMYVHDQVHMYMYTCWSIYRLHLQDSANAAVLCSGAVQEGNSDYQEHAWRCHTTEAAGKVTWPVTWYVVSTD